MHLERGDSTHTLHIGCGGHFQCVAANAALQRTSSSFFHDVGKVLSAAGHRSVSRRSHMIISTPKQRDLLDLHLSLGHDGHLSHPVVDDTPGWNTSSHSDGVYKSFHEVLEGA